MIFAVDFDGTITEQKWPDIGKEQKYALFVLKKLQKNGHKIILWTGRNGNKLVEAVNWLSDGGFRPDAVNANLFFIEGMNNPKIHADIYLEDKSFPAFNNWAAVYNVFIKGRPIHEYCNKDGLWCEKYLFDKNICKYECESYKCEGCSLRKYPLDYEDILNEKLDQKE